MPISATGILSSNIFFEKYLSSTHRGVVKVSPCRLPYMPRSCKGFTLLELMVVLLIIGITLTFITFSVSTREDEIGMEARRLAALINLAKDEAILNTKEYGWSFTENEYGFVQFVEDGWEELEDDEVLRRRKLPDGVSFEVYLEGERVAQEDFSLTENEEMQPPRIYLLSSGEYTPFSIVLADQYSDIKFTVLGVPPGKITLAEDLAETEEEE